MHIVFFNRAFFPEISATAQLLTELAEGLVRDHGCEVTVVAGIPQGTQTDRWSPPARGGLLWEERLGGVTVLRARGTSFSKQRLAGRIANYLSYFAVSCMACFRLRRPSVVIALTDPPIIGLAALLAAARYRCPLIISYRDLFPEVARLLDGFRNPAVEAALNAVNRILIRRSWRVIALGEAMKRRIVQKGARPERVAVIPDWGDTEAILPGPKDSPFSRQQGLADRFVVMHAGNIGASQNLERLIEAAGLLQDLPELLLVFVGDGVRKAPLERQAAGLRLQNVRFLPFQPKQLLTQVFGAADCFVVSLKPGLAGCITPSKLYTILAAGKPYVTSVDPDCDIARITQRHGSGLVARVDDPADLAAMIRRLHGDPGLRKRLGENARTASSSFSRASGVRAYFELCRAARG